MRSLLLALSLLTVAPPLALAAPADDPASGLDPRLAEFFGPVALRTMLGADRVEAFRMSADDWVEPIGKRAAGRIGGWLVGAGRGVLDPGQRVALADVLLHSRHYLLPDVPLREGAVRDFETIKACRFGPEIAFRFSRTEGRRVETADVLLSLRCNDVGLVLRPEQRKALRRRGEDARVATLDISSGRPALLRVIRAVLPDDRDLQALVPDDRVLWLIGELGRAQEVEAFRVQRAPDDARAYRRWRVVDPSRQAADLYELGSTPRTLPERVRVEALTLFRDELVYRPPVPCELKAAYGLRFHLPRERGEAQRSIDLFLGPECGTLEAAVLRTENQWRSSQFILESGIADRGAMLQLLARALPDAPEFESVRRPAASP